MRFYTLSNFTYVLSKDIKFECDTNLIFKCKVRRRFFSSIVLQSYSLFFSFIEPNARFSLALAGSRFHDWNILKKNNWNIAALITRSCQTSLHRGGSFFCPNNRKSEELPRQCLSSGYLQTRLSDFFRSFLLSALGMFGFWWPDDFCLEKLSFIRKKSIMIIGKWRNYRN